MTDPSRNESRRLGDLIFKHLLRGKKTHAWPVSGIPYPIARLCDSTLLHGRGDEDLSVDLITPFHEGYDRLTDQRLSMESAEKPGRVLFRLPASPSAAEIGLRLAAQATGANATGKRDRASDTVDPGLLAMVGDMFHRSVCWGLGRTLDLSGDDPEERLGQALNTILPEVFTRFDRIGRRHPSPRKEIKSRLTSLHRERDQLTLDLDPAEGEDLKTVRAFLNRQFANQGAITLSALIDHFFHKPYGWPDWETVSRAASLYSEGMCSFVMDDRRLNSDESLEALRRVRSWPAVVLIPKAAAIGSDLDLARSLGQALFPDPPPETLGRMAAFFRARLIEWQKQIKGLREKTSSAGLPGKKVLFDGQNLLSRLVAIAEPAEFIKTFSKLKPELETLSATLGTLNHFFDNQYQQWMALNQTARRIAPNRPFLEDVPEARPILADMDRVLSSPEPQTQMNAAPDLIESLNRLHDSLIEAHRRKALAAVSRIGAQARDLLDETRAPGDIRNKILYPLNQIQGRVEQETDIAGLKELEKQAHEVLDTAATLMRPSDPAQPPVEIVDISPAAHTPKALMGTPEEVDRFLAELGRVLHEAVGKGQCIRII